MSSKEEIIMSRMNDDGIMVGMIDEDEVCPFCGELLWSEWGYYSYRECIFWDYYLYKVIDFPISHYR